MTVINLRQLSGKSSLLTRATADTIMSEMGELQELPSTTIVVDLSGVIAITPSFLDQFIGGLKRLAATRAMHPLRIRLLAVPTHASEKFAAVGRSHGLILQEKSADEWLLEEPEGTGLQIPR